MTRAVEVMHADELRARRAELLAASGLNEDELRRRAAVYSLPPDLVAVLSEIDEIDYLLGE